MDKKKMILTSLASVAVLGSGFLASNPSTVKAEDAQPTATQPATTDTKEALKAAFEKMEKAVEDKINKDDSIKPEDKVKAIEEAKAEIGKEDILKAIENGDLDAEDVAKELEDDFNKAGVTNPTVQPAPGAELVRNESGEVTEAKPVNGGIDADSQDKINKRLDEEKTDAKDAGERVEAAKNDVEEAKTIVEAAKAAKEKAQKELDSYADADGEQADQYREAAQKDLDAADKALEAAQAELKAREADLKAEEAKLDTTIEALQNKVADLEKEASKLEDNLKDAEANGSEDYIKEGLQKELDVKRAELEKAEAALEAALKGLEPESSNGDAAILDKPEYTEPQTEPQKESNKTPDRPAKPAPEFPIPAKVGTPGNPAPASETPAPVSETPAGPSADAPSTESPAAPAPGTNSPASEVPSAPATAAQAVAGTSQDNTYQAPAAKAEDKKELPNTGGKDNVAIASLGFLGLLLGALPFVKRKN